MNFFVGMLVVCINILITIKNFKSGMIMYIICVFTLPNIHINGFILEYDNIMFIIMMILYFLNNKINKKVYTVNKIIFIYFFIMLLSTLIAINKYTVVSIGIIKLISYLKLMLVLLILLNTLDKFEDYIFIFKFITVINFIVSIIQITTPKSVDIFYKFYYTPSMVPLREVMNLGYFNRAYGTFGTPVKLGSFCLIAYSIFLVIGNRNKMKVSNYIYIIISLITGVLALSKTTIIGVPIITIIYSILKMNKLKFKFKIQNIIIIPSILCIIGITINFLQEKGLSIMWYLRYLKNPFDALSTRYSGTNGFLLETMGVIKENLIMGVGSTNVRGEFLGDSTFVLAMHDVGMLGILVLIVLFLHLLLSKNLKFDRRIIIITISLIITGLAMPSLFDYIGLITIGLIYSIKREDYIKT